MTEATPEPETTVLDEVTGALRFILAFYEPGQRHLDTEAWKHAEAGGRRALARGEAALAALQEQRAEISRLQQELSACKAERDQWRASAAEFKGLCEEWQALAEAAEQKFEAASEAYENLQFDAGAERQRANAAEAREKQLRAALKLAVDIVMVNEPGDSRAVSDEAVALAAVVCECDDEKCWAVIDQALASKEGGE